MEFKYTRKELEDYEHHFRCVRCHQEKYDSFYYSVYVSTREGHRNFCKECLEVLQSMPSIDEMKEGMRFENTFNDYRYITGSSIKSYTFFKRSSYDKNNMVVDIEYHSGEIKTHVIVPIANLYLDLFEFALPKGPNVVTAKKRLEDIE